MPRDIGGRFVELVCNTKAQALTMTTALPVKRVALVLVFATHPESCASGAQG